MYCTTMNIHIVSINAIDSIVGAFITANTGNVSLLSFLFVSPLSFVTIKCSTPPLANKSSVDNTLTGCVLLTLGCFFLTITSTLLLLSSVVSPTSSGIFFQLYAILVY